MDCLALINSLITKQCSDYKQTETARTSAKVFIILWLFNSSCFLSRLCRIDNWVHIDKTSHTALHLSPLTGLNYNQNIFTFTYSSMYVLCNGNVRHLKPLLYWINMILLLLYRNLMYTYTYVSIAMFLEEIKN